MGMIEVLRDKIMGSTGGVDTMLVKPISFSERQTEIERSLSFKNSTCIKSSGFNAVLELNPKTCIPDSGYPGPIGELDAAAVKLQKVYKSYRTRRNLADCAVVVEELWWKALDFASLERSSISFFDGEKPESVSSRWSRARTRAAKVGKGLSKNAKGQKLALQHWLEAIDPRHRYGHNLHFYYNLWFKSESTQPFFYWLDIGDGKELNLEKLSRNTLQKQRVKYLGPNEREAYEVNIKNGKLIYKQSNMLVNTIEGSKWIFVLSTSRAMYVGKKKKGRFQHSSFLSGGVATAAGRLIAKEGILKAVWPHSGHYQPTEENFKELICFLQDNHVDLTNVKTCSFDDDESLSLKKSSKEGSMKEAKAAYDLTKTEVGEYCETETDESPRASAKSVFDVDITTTGPALIDLDEQTSFKWTSGAGPRIGCVRDYPTDLQSKALEQVNLPPTDDPLGGNNGPIPSPRPTQRTRISPVLANMSFSTSTIIPTLPKLKIR